jgi:hypothetical protein
MEKDEALCVGGLGFGWIEDFWMEGTLFHLLLLSLTGVLHGFCFVLLLAFGTLLVESDVTVFHI